MKKIYMSGVGGMLGEEFFNVFNNDYDVLATDIDLNEKWLRYLDFRDYESYKKNVIDYNPDYLFHIGAYTDLEFCENNIADTYLTNTISVENAVLIANTLDIPVLYISTAGIFDGKKQLYDDWDLPNPLCHYARSKFAGEEYVKNFARRFLILRAGWMMGGGIRKDKKFINKIITKLLNGEKILNIVNDKMGTPTYTYDFAQNAKLILEKEIWGLYNLVCNGQTSRLEVAKEILHHFNLENTVKINEVSSEFFAKEYFAPRPSSEQLINLKLSIRKLNIMRDWKVALESYLTRDFSNIM